MIHNPGSLRVASPLKFLILSINRWIMQNILFLQNNGSQFWSMISDLILPDLVLANWSPHRDVIHWVQLDWEENDFKWKTPLDFCAFLFL